MKRFRSVMGQSPAIVISLIALTFSLGSGAGYAASSATSHPAATKVTWHPLALTNGWKSAAPAFHGVGNPAYSISNGVVYLTGALDRGSSSSAFAVLPRAARPRHTLWIGVYSGATSTQDLEILANGKMFFAGANATYFSSLAGVDFPLGS